MDSERVIKPPRCARKGCRKRVLPTALEHRDPYCSTSCFKADHGIA